VIATYGGRKQAQAVLGQTGFVSVNDPRLHFGLGAAKSAELEIRWPNGLKEILKNVEAGRLVTVKEGAGIVKSEPFRRGR